MSRQTVVNTQPDVATPGQLSEYGVAPDIITKIESDAAGAAAGLMLVQGTNDDQCKLPAASTDITTILNPLGVSMYDPSKMVNWPPGTTLPYPQNMPVPLIRKGRVWVTVEEAVTPASTVYVRYAAGGNGVGSFGASDPGSAAAAMPTGTARYMTTAGINGLALVEINLP